jgi:hypothetical protein
VKTVILFSHTPVIEECGTSNHTSAEVLEVS